MYNVIKNISLASPEGNLISIINQVAASVTAVLSALGAAVFGLITIICGTVFIVLCILWMIDIYKGEHNAGAKYSTLLLGTGIAALTGGITFAVFFGG